MIEIKQVLKDSIAEDLGMEQGDKILSINGNTIEDFLDLHYYESEPLLVLIFQKDGQNYEIEIEKEQGRALGITPSRDDMTTCSNNCIFCFIKQNPPGMRRQIYVCDEDYRYSFLQGNFVTLTDARQEDLERIARQKLSPLYISIHATDPQARKQLFQFEDYIPILEKLEYLDQHNIEMHTQIVLV
ncbi:MAG TPA: PDZ domain-containing protein, partial [bacterium]|nr:PDZ domain-containing protein [bacterium]